MKSSRQILMAVLGVVILLTAGTSTALSNDFLFPQVIRTNDDPYNQNYHYTWSSGMRNVAVFYTNVYTVWTDYRQGYPEAYLGLSLDQGNTFSNIKLSDDLSGAPHSYPSLAVDQMGIPYIAWMDGRQGNWGVYFAKYVHGRNVNIPVALPAQPDDWAGFPTIAVSPVGHAVYIAWQEFSAGQNRIKFSRSLDAGSSFGRAVEQALGYYPAIVRGNQNEIYIGWSSWDEATGNWLLEVAKSVDGGLSFAAPVKVNAQAPLNTMQFYPSLAAGDGGLFVSWTQFEGDFSLIYAAKSIDGGATFGPATPVSDAPAGTQHGVSSAAVDAAGTLYLAWCDVRTGHSQIYMSKSVTGGQSFEPAHMVSQNQSNGYYNCLASIAVDAESNVYALWGGASIASNIPEVYFSYGYNMVNLLTPPETVILSQPGAYLSAEQALFSYQGQTGNTRNMTYSYQLDGGTWSSWSANSSLNWNSLSQGWHTFKVKAQDGVDQTDSSPAHASFLVDYTKPTLSVAKVKARYDRTAKLNDINLKGSAADQLSGLMAGTYRLVSDQGQVLAEGGLEFSASGKFNEKINLNNINITGSQVQLLVTVKDKAGNQTQNIPGTFPVRRP